jgi:hypothetical protein
MCTVLVHVSTKVDSRCGDTGRHASGHAQIAHDSHDSEQDTLQFPYTITEKLQDTLRQALDSAESPRDLGVA